MSPTPKVTREGESYHCGALFTMRQNPAKPFPLIVAMDDGETGVCQIDSVGNANKFSAILRITSAELACLAALCAEAARG